MSRVVRPLDALQPRGYAEAQGRWLAHAPVVLVDDGGVVDEEAARGYHKQYPGAHALLWRDDRRFPVRWLATAAGLAAHDNMAVFLYPTAVLQRYVRALSLISPDAHDALKSAARRVGEWMTDLARLLGPTERLFPLRAADDAPPSLLVVRDTGAALVVSKTTVARGTSAVEADIVLMALRLIAALLTWRDQRPVPVEVRLAEDNAWLCILDREHRGRHVRAWGRGPAPTTVLHPAAWPPASLVWPPAATAISARDESFLFPTFDAAVPALFEHAAHRRLVLGSSPDFLASGLRAQRVLPLETSSGASLLVRWLPFDVTSDEWPRLCAKANVPVDEALPWNLYIGTYVHPLAASAPDIAADESATERAQVKQTLVAITRHLRILCVYEDGVAIA